MRQRAVCWTGIDSSIKSSLGRMALQRTLDGVLIGLLLTGSSVLAVNNDGKTDIYWRNYSIGDDSAWTMDGGGYASTVTMAWQGDTNWKMVGTGDFDNDGELDLLWRNTITGANVVWFLVGGMYRSSTLLQSLSDTNWEVVGTGYFDGITDKNIDILWRNKATGDNAIWFMNGTTLASTALLQEVPDLNWKIGGTGDFNNDGFTDIVWHHAITGLNYVWYMQGGNLVTTAQLPTASELNWEIVGTGYFSGLHDNTVDLLWRNKSTGDNAIWQMNGTTYLSSILLPWVALDWGVGGTGDAKVDTDNDGLPDIWERRFFGNLSPTAASDPDGDGQSNLAEYQNGSDPTTNNNSPSLNIALDNNYLTWTSGGNAPWGLYTGDSYAGGSCAKSGTIGSGQTSWMETSVIGPGTVTFDYKFTTQTYDSFSLRQTLPNGSLLNRTLSLANVWQQIPVDLYAGTNTVRFSLTSQSSQGAAYVDNVQVLYSTNNLHNLQDALDDYDHFYTTGGSGWVGYLEWYRETGSGTGGDVAHSGVIADNGSSYVSTSVTGPGTLSFWWRVSSEQGYDFLNFYVNGVLQNSMSGENSGSEAYNLSAGTFELKWSYEKDYSGSDGDDSAWLDAVKFIPAADADHDGLPDIWEIQYFGNTTGQKGSDDYDLDQLTNLQEYLLGTNPTLAELQVKVLTPRRNSLLP